MKKLDKYLDLARELKKNPTKHEGDSDNNPKETENPGKDWDNPDLSMIVIG